MNLKFPMNLEPDVPEEPLELPLFLKNLMYLKNHLNLMNLNFH
jgi:hypothetical protein